MAELQNKRPELLRDRRGRVRPGHTANPGGRPKGWKEFQEAMRERTPQAVAKIDQALRSDDPAVYQWAVDKALAYGWGRPPQRVQLGGDEDAPPVAVEHTIDWGRLPPEKLLLFLQLTEELAGGGDGPGGGG